MLNLEITQVSNQRVICLVPSISEILYALGLDEEVVGITRYCVHPKVWHEGKTIIGGTKDPKLKKIVALNPSLIIANDEENRKEDVIALREAGYRVYISHIETFSDLINCISELAVILQRDTVAQTLVDDLTVHYERLKSVLLFEREKQPKVLYLIWRNPFMAVAQNTWINHILVHLGCINACAHLSRYPIIDLDKLDELEVDYVFLSSEPYSFKEKHIEEILRKQSNIKCILVDGEVFSWYGPRLLYLEQEVKKIAMTLSSLES